jgi:hypothetical protein
VVHLKIQVGWEHRRRLAVHHQRWAWDLIARPQECPIENRRLMIFVREYQVLCAQKGG